MNQNGGEGSGDDGPEESIDCGGVCPACGGNISFGSFWNHFSNNIIT